MLSLQEVCQIIFYWPLIKYSVGRGGKYLNSLQVTLSMSWETHDAHHVTPISIISALISSIGFRLCTHSAITTHHSPGIHHQSSPHVGCWSVPAAGILTLGKGGEYYETLKPHKVPKWLNSKLFMRNFRGGNLHSHLGGPWGSRSQVKSIRC